MTAPTSPRRGEGSEPVTVARISLISAIAVALIGAAAAVATTLIRHQPPDTATSPPTLRTTPPPPAPGDGETGDMPVIAPFAGQAQVTFFDSETVARIRPRAVDVTVSGTVSGLGRDTLWILAFHTSGGGYWLVQTPGLASISPAASADGEWRVVDQSPGDVSDHGQYIIYYAVQADPSCARDLTSLPDVSRPIRRSDLVAGCRFAKRGPSVLVM